MRGGALYELHTGSSDAIARTLAQGGRTMRKRWMVWGISGAALAALALLGGMADRAAAQTTTRAWLGVTSQEITTDLREGLNYKGDGVLVSRVVVDSPADRAGIKKGDVLVS